MGSAPGGRPTGHAVGATLLLLAFLLTGCSSSGPAPVDSRDGTGPVPEGFYRIRGGDTLDAISLRTDVDSETLAEWNRLSPPYEIYAGSLLRVAPPRAGARKPAAPKRVAQAADRPVRKADSGKAVKRKPAGPAASTRVQADGGSGLKWKWPLGGKVVQTYRKGDRTRQGIRIRGRAGQSVTAAEAGTVVYSGSGLKGYGNLIILKHTENYLSAYGFNSRLLVAEGQRVKRGQSVAEVGQAAGGGYLLHFEIRRNGTAVDPLRYLPGSG